MTEVALFVDRKSKKDTKSESAFGDSAATGKQKKDLVCSTDEQRRTRDTTKEQTK